MTSTEPVNEWRSALLEFALLVGPVPAEWMLVGSAATAIRGVPVRPGDVDVLARRPEDVERIASVMPSVDDALDDTEPGTFLSSRGTPVLTFGEGSWVLGRWHLSDVKVEVAHIRSDSSEEDLLLETSGDPVWSERSLVELQGVSIPTVPVEVQIATMMMRDQHERLAQTLERVETPDLRISLLRRALSDRGLTDTSPLPTSLQNALAI